MAVLATSLSAGDLPPAEIYVLGETHDNPAHHLAQAEMVAQISPTAIVFEQLTEVQAGRVTAETPRTLAGLEAALAWSDSGWPPLEIYLPVFEAAGAAVIVGAAGEAGDLSAYGLDQPLPPDQQAEREALQAAAHCDALPTEILPQFVARQRAIDAQFAARTLDALDRFGPPVVLITGNGHARRDWGVPAAVARVRPQVSVITVLQGEAGAAPEGGGDLVLDAPAQERGDPCDAFR